MTDEQFNTLINEIRSMKEAYVSLSKSYFDLKDKVVRKSKSIKTDLVIEPVEKEDDIWIIKESLTGNYFGEYRKGFRNEKIAIFVDNYSAAWFFIGRETAEKELRELKLEIRHDIAFCETKIVEDE